MDENQVVNGLTELNKFADSRIYNKDTFYKLCDKLTPKTFEFLNKFKYKKSHGDGAYKCNLKISNAFVFLRISYYLVSKLINELRLYDNIRFAGSSAIFPDEELENSLYSDRGTAAIGLFYLF